MYRRKARLGLESPVGHLMKRLNEFWRIPLWEKYFSRPSLYLHLIFHAPFLSACRPAPTAVRSRNPTGSRMQNHQSPRILLTANLASILPLEHGEVLYCAHADKLFVPAAPPRSSRGRASRNGRLTFSHPRYRTAPSTRARHTQAISPLPPAAIPISQSHQQPD